MARPREFDANDALDKAMKVFWEKGYVNTSIDDLVNATGVNRYSLYEEFESKHGLFLASLDHYQNTVVRTMLGMIERPDASLADIRAYFAMLAQVSSTEMGKQGCLMANSSSEVAPHDKRAANKVEKFRARLQAGFKNALSNANDNGELPTGFDVERSADFLTGIFLGVSVMARSGANPKMMANMVEVALSTLE